MTTRYPRQVFELILQRLSTEDRDSIMQWHKVLEDGVYVRSIDELMKHGELTPEEADAVAWHPQNDLSIPALPFPFTASELAAFCFPGSGVALVEIMENDDGLDYTYLERLGRNGDKARSAIRTAYRMLVEINERFSLLAHPSKDETALSENARTALRWLLNDADKWASSPIGVTPRVIAQEFGGIFLDEGSWKSTLSDPPKWLLPARSTRGQAPRPSTWNPVTVASLACRQWKIPESRFDARFLTGSLKHWCDSWTGHKSSLKGFGS